MGAHAARTRAEEGRNRLITNQPWEAFLMEKWAGWAWRDGEARIRLERERENKMNCSDGGWLLTTHDADGLRLGGRWGLDGAWLWWRRQ